MDIGSSYHGQILVQTPLNGFGHEKTTVGYFNAVHAAVIVELCMLRPPQGGVRLLACPARMIPEDKGSLFFASLKASLYAFCSNGLESFRKIALKCPGGMERVISLPLIRSIPNFFACF